MKILHDLHVHNILSSCCGQSGATTENYIKREMELGMKVFGLANHVWDERVPTSDRFYEPQTIRHAEEAKTAFKYVPHDGLRCLFGAETEYDGNYECLGMTLEGAKHFDYLLVPTSHQHRRGRTLPDYPEVIEMRAVFRARVREACPELAEEEIDMMTNTLKERHLMRYVPEFKTDLHRFFIHHNIQNLIQLTENETFRQICKAVPTSIAHTLSFNFRGNDCAAMIDDDTLRDCFTRVKNAGAYLEIATQSLRAAQPNLSQNNMIRYFVIAKEVGCQFTFGSDAHSLESLSEVLTYGEEIANLIGLTKSDIAEHVRDSIIE
ncbi:MAG: hypothetical protein E7668_02410 [Ruminococcaceae bacterium]|nr:hypothetical protein [Oscillospiraceae bacterium]